MPGMTAQFDRTICYQVNLQRSFGGGEVYTRFFTEALAALGCRSVLLIARGAAFWRNMELPGATLLELEDAGELVQALPAERSLVVTHNTFGPELSGEIARRHLLTGFAHMPLYDRGPGGFASYARIFAVSRHVLDSLSAKGLANVHPEPMYGVADLAARPAGAKAGIAAGSIYDWDRRKFRDRLLGTLEPIAARLVRERSFVRRPGLTLGIVSRLTPIKQFPLMFSIIAPILAQHSGINLEIFGSGGYASVRDLRRSLAILGDRVRFWGYQPDVREVYPALDYVLSGLPEKEALGLNLIEAQVCGTPVLAVNAPPFTETVLDGATGYLFEDPRRDGGETFAHLLKRLAAGPPRPDPRAVSAHLERFSDGAFRRRVADALASLDL
jgi:glycosyltransferase involved in cell wall biosynthesis